MDEGVAAPGHATGAFSDLLSPVPERTVHQLDTPSAPAFAELDTLAPPPPDASGVSANASLPDTSEALREQSSAHDTSGAPTGDSAYLGDATRAMHDASVPFSPFDISALLTRAQNALVPKATTEDLNADPDFKNMFSEDLLRAAQEEARRT